MAVSRRTALFGGSALLALTAAYVLRPSGASGEVERGTFEFTLTEAEWRTRLSPLAYAVLREEATERPYTSPLLDEHRPGIFSCAGCDLPLFDAATKYDSRTGWPSFWEPLDNAIGESIDYHLGYARTEVHCRRCGGHQGHVFPDGPPPTGLRYCINGVALNFTPAETA